MFPPFSHIDHFDVSLAPYKAYDPCRFYLQNILYGQQVEAISGEFGINNTTGKDGQVWTLDNPAPMGRVTDSFQANSATLERLSCGAIARLVGLACMTVVMVRMMQ